MHAYQVCIEVSRTQDGVQSVKELTKGLEGSGTKTKNKETENKATLLRVLCRDECKPQLYEDTEERDKDNV